MCLNYSIEKKLPQPKSTQEIDCSELKRLLRTRFPSEGEIYLSDHKYKLCSIDDIRVFCAQDDTNHQKYVAEDYDCDDFSYRLMGQFSIPNWSVLALGICWTNLHVINCFVGEDKQLYFLEPQTDTISSHLAPWQGTHLRCIMM